MMPFIGPSEAAFRVAFIFLVLGGLGQSAGQSDHRDIGCWDPKRHSGPLAVEFGDYLAYGLGLRVLEGMIFVAAARPPRQSFSEGPTTVFRIAVTACTVVIRPSTIPNLLCTTLARGARQFVVQEALETAVICFRYTHDKHGGIF